MVGRFRDHFEREMCRVLADLLREKPAIAALGWDLLCREIESGPVAVS